MEEIDKALEEADRWTDERTGCEIVYMPEAARKIVAKSIFDALPAQREIPLDNQQAYEWGYADGKAEQREVRYPDKIQVNFNTAAVGWDSHTIHYKYKIEGFNQAIDEMKKLNGG